MIKSLRTLSSAGWFIGPKESYEAFVKRIDNQKNFNQTTGYNTLHDLPAVWNYLEKVMCVKPDWIPFFYSNKQLALWEGAASWTSKEANWIQLRKAFKSGRFLLSCLEEVLLHEAVHSLRVAFEEPRFEEILAYSTASRAYRRFLGPLFSSKKQTGIFLLSLLLVSFTKLPLIVYLSWSFFRLIRDQKHLKRALKTLARLFPEVPPKAVAIRLTDDEILLFSKGDCKQIESYLASKQKDLRWMQIFFIR